MKSKRVSRLNRARYFILAVILWPLLKVTYVLFFGMLVAAFASLAPPVSESILAVERQLTHVILIISYAAVHRYLISRFLSIDTRRWLHWTLVGALVGTICHILFTAAVPAPETFWWIRRINPPTDTLDGLVRDLYHALRMFFRFGLVALFQYFALPSQVPRRRFWLLGAVLSAPLWLINGALAIAVQAFAAAMIVSSGRIRGRDDSDVELKFEDEAIRVGRLRHANSGADESSPSIPRKELATTALYCASTLPTPRDARRLSTAASDS